MECRRKSLVQSGKLTYLGPGIKHIRLTNTYNRHLRNKHNSPSINVL